MGTTAVTVNSPNGCRAANLNIFAGIWTHSSWRLFAAVHETAHEVPPSVRVGHVETPSPYTEYGIKGGGEGGRMGAPPAICAAIEDALRLFGVKIDAMPVTPAKLRGLIRASESRVP
jgi:hypothetical protein